MLFLCLYNAYSKRAESLGGMQVGRRMGIIYMRRACNPVVKAVAHSPSLLEDTNFGQLPGDVSRF